MLFFGQYKKNAVETINSKHDKGSEIFKNSELIFI